MMMIHRNSNGLQHPTVEIPPWDPPYDDPTSLNTPTNHHLFSPQTTNDYFTALQRYLPSSNEFPDDSTEFDSDDPTTEFDSFSCDEFRMYEFKIRKCARGRSHDWTECPFAHPGEKARRRDPRRFHYSGTACPEFRRGSCRKGDACEYAHGVFECWLHPARYRTQPCKDGPHCKRRVCFFAHSPDQLRVLPHSTESTRFDSSELGEFDSPPVSPSSYELVGAMRGLQIGAGKNININHNHSNNINNMSMSVSPRSPWGVHMGGSGFGSPRSPTRGYLSLPSTPTRTRSGLGLFDPWDLSIEEEQPMERVESGKGIRAKIYAKLSKENSLDRERVDSVSSAGPDFGWVSELVK